MLVASRKAQFCESSGGARFAERLCLRLTPASAPESCGCSGLAEPLHGACLGHPETLLLHSCLLPGSCTRSSEVTGPRYSWKPCLELDPYRRTLQRILQTYWMKST